MNEDKDLEVGDLVNIFWSISSLVPPTDAMGIITEIVGYKTVELVDGETQSWDMSDLKKMAVDKAQDATGAGPPVSLDLAVGKV
jgi:hypothetical protein